MSILQKIYILENTIYHHTYHWFNSVFLQKIIKITHPFINSSTQNMVWKIRLSDKYCKWFYTRYRDKYSPSRVNYQSITICSNQFYGENPCPSLRLEFRQWSLQEQNSTYDIRSTYLDSSTDHLYSLLNWEV